jgi:hypothetical protein
LKLKEDFSTLFPQVFHYKKTNKDKGFGKFFTRFGVPLLVFHIMWICASLTFLIFVLTKGSTLACPQFEFALALPQAIHVSGLIQEEFEELACPQFVFG